MIKRIIKNLNKCIEVSNETINENEELINAYFNKVQRLIDKINFNRSLSVNKEFMGEKSNYEVLTDLIEDLTTIKNRIDELRGNNERN